MQCFPDPRTCVGGGNAQGSARNGSVPSSAPENHYNHQRRGDQTTAHVSAEPQTYEYPYPPCSSPVSPSLSTLQYGYGSSQPQGGQTAASAGGRAYTSQQPVTRGTSSSSTTPYAYSYGSQSQPVQSTAAYPITYQPAQPNMDHTHTRSSAGARMYNPPQTGTGTGHSYQMNRFLDEVPPATVLLAIPGSERKAEGRGRRHRDALRSRVRVIEGRVR